MQPRHVIRIALGTTVLAAGLLGAACTDGWGWGREFRPPMEPPQEEEVIYPSAPPPISGGTLAITPDDRFAIAADPDTDRIWVVDLQTRTLQRALEVPDGAEPGRVAVEPSGRAHVVLRGTGQLISFDPAGEDEPLVRPACNLPRGLVFAPEDGLLHVACADGQLVSLPAAGGDPTRRLQLEHDLRDVVVDGTDLVVSRFRSAELLRIDPSGTITSRLRPPVFEFGLAARRFEPAVAWRLLSTPKGGFTVVHQRALATPVSLAPSSPSQPSPYGGGANGASQDIHCSNILHGATTQWSSTGHVFSIGISATLPVDAAWSPDGKWLAVVSAATGEVIVRGGSELLPQEAQEGCQFPGLKTPTGGNPVAVAFTSQGTLLVQKRPGFLRWANGGAQFDFPLRAAEHPGHALFHRAAAGSSLACASCHPDAHEDGRVWHFEPMGPRRTQTLRGGIAQTAPFHWDGDLPDLGGLMNEVFVRRMGGAPLRAGEVEALEHWLMALPAAAAPHAPAPDAAERGRILYESAEAGCASCHSGPLLSNGASADVGTGGSFQVPSLLGVSARDPFMHDGCATTLEDRFGPCGGGDQHGKTSALSRGQLSDLVAYLKTL